MCDRHYGVGALGIVLIETSSIADVKMRVFNSDGTEGQMAGNCIRCLGKYVRDHGIVTGEEITVETVSGIRRLELHMRNGLVGSVTVDMGKASLETAKIPCTLETDTVIDHPVEIGGREYRITCVNVGNPHCVVFADRVDAVDLAEVGPEFEYAPFFPERINTEFVRVVNPTTLRMRVWERGNGETMACGTGACAAVIAAVEREFCRKGEEITVKTSGGDLLVRYTDEGVTLSGKASLVYEGEIEY
jgi:carbamoyl-phosphate synthase large subunit